MDEILWLFGTVGRVRSDSLASDTSQSTGNKQVLRQRLNQLITCVDDLDPKDRLHEKVSKTLDNTFIICGKKANKPKRDSFRLHMVTWNVATADPPEDVTSLLHLNSSKSPDLYVIGLQEVYSGPLRFMSDMAFDDPWSHLFMSTLAPLRYIKGNKGGVSIRLNCHLAAHMKYATERVDEFKYILDMQTFDSKKAPGILDHSGKKRKLAWSDRILWRMRPRTSPRDEDDEDVDPDVAEMNAKQQEEDEEYPLKICQDMYTSNMEYSISDHKPVVGTFTLELRKMYINPLVRLEPEGDWSADIDAMVLYSPLQPFPSSTWDWIGLYKVGFTSVSDYITYTWVKDDKVSLNDEVIQVYVSKEEIPVLGGECVLCHYSRTLECIIGISEPFKNAYMNDKFMIKIETWHKSDMGDQNNVHRLDEETWQDVDVYIDIADRSNIDAKDYNPDHDPAIFESKETGRGPLGPNWKNELANNPNCPHMCAYKLVTVEFKWLGLQKKVESLIQKVERRLFTNFHRQLFCWIDNWIELSMDDIQNQEDQTKKELDEMRKTNETKGMAADEN